MSRVVCSAAFALMLTACATNPRLGESKQPTQVRVATELPPPMPADIAVVGAPFLISPYDKIGIVVLGVQELSGEVVVDGAGRVSMPLLGEIDTTGQTPAQLAEFITAGLRRHDVLDPKVAVNIVESKAQMFAVDGQVKEPGMYPAVGNLSLMRAIATAQGISEFGRAEDVVVFRKVGGQPMAALFNLDAIRHGLYQDPRIYPNDVVVVGDDRSKRLFKDLLTTLPSLATPLVILLQRR